MSLRQEVRKAVSILMGTPECVKVMESSVAEIQWFFRFVERKIPLEMGES